MYWREHSLNQFCVLLFGDEIHFIEEQISENINMEASLFMQNFDIFCVVTFIIKMHKFIAP